MEYKSVPLGSRSNKIRTWNGRIPTAKTGLKFVVQNRGWEMKKKRDQVPAFQGKRRRMPEVEPRIWKEPER